MTLLTLTLTIGIMVVVGMLAWRLSVTGPAPALPDAVALPAGERLTGYAQNPDWTVLITTDDTGTQRLHLIRPGATTPHQSLTISP